MKKIILTCFMSVMALFLSACVPQEKEMPYNAKLFDKAEYMLTNEFLSENETHYPSSEDGLPESRCRIIDNNEEFEYAFASFPEKLDFSHDILVVYSFTDIYYGFECKLSDITESENKLAIIIKHEMAKPSSNGAIPPSTSMPIQRSLVIKLSDCRVDNVKINLIYS